MGQASRKIDKSTFLFFIPKWSDVKDPKEITSHKAKKTHSLSSAICHASFHFADSIQPRHLNPSLLGAVITAQDNHESNTKSVMNLVVDSSFEVNRDLFSKLIITDADENKLTILKARQINNSDAQKRANLPNEIFNYIYLVYCKNLFALAWYSDMTYIKSEKIA